MSRSTLSLLPSPFRIAILSLAAIAAPLSADDSLERKIEEALDAEEDAYQSLADRRTQIRALLDQPYPVRRMILEKDLTVKTKTFKLSSGKEATVVFGRPKKAKETPTVFIIDVESVSTYESRARSLSARAWGMNRRTQADALTTYLTHSPFGSNLLGQGFAVAYLVAEDLQTLRSAKTIDWLDAFEYTRELRGVDSNSFFLFSTKEYANLSLYLASNYSFNGFILEEPHYMLFSRSTNDDILNNAGRLTSDEIWGRVGSKVQNTYRSIFSGITTPILLVRAEGSQSYAFNDKTLIPMLEQSNVYVQSLTLERPARIIKTMGGESGVLDIAPNISYYTPTLSVWLENMMAYLKQNSYSKPVELEKPSLAYMGR